MLENYDLEKTELLLIRVLHIHLQRIGWQEPLDEWQSKRSQVLDSISSNEGLYITQASMDAMLHLWHAASAGDPALIFLRALMLLDLMLPLRHWEQRDEAAEHEDSLKDLSRHYPDIFAAFEAALRLIDSAAIDHLLGEWSMPVEKDRDGNFLMHCVPRLQAALHSLPARIWP